MEIVITSLIGLLKELSDYKRISKEVGTALGAVTPFLVSAACFPSALSLTLPGLHQKLLRFSSAVGRRLGKGPLG